jgi:hypothetical protein
MKKKTQKKSQKKSQMRSRGMLGCQRRTKKLSKVYKMHRRALASGRRHLWERISQHLQIFKKTKYFFSP